MKLKRISEFITEATLEYTPKEMSEIKDYIHDPEVFVYANQKLYDFCSMFCSQLNKYAKFNLFIDGQFGKINGEKAVLFLDKKTGACIGFVPMHGRTMYASLYYFKEFREGETKADFYMSSETIGIVKLIKMFCDMIRNQENIDSVSLTEAYDMNQRKLIVTPSAETYVKELLTIKPGQKGNGRNKVWEGNWTDELVAEIQSGVNIFDIAMDVETYKAKSKYWKYFGAEARMGADKRDTLLIYLARQAGINMRSDAAVAVNDSIYSDEDEWFERVTKMSKAEAEKIIKSYDENSKSIKEIIGDYTKFYKANGADKLEILSYTPQLLIVPGKGGIGKTSIVKRMLKDAGLRENVDFYCTGSMSSDAESIYNVCYDYNGKIIVLDDIPELFAGANRQSLWKNLISGNMGEYGKPSCPVRQTNSRYYDPKKFGIDMRARYYAEAGDESTLSGSKARALNAALKSSDPTVRRKAEKELEDMEMSSENVVKPSSFTFTGVIIALSNVSPKEMRQEIGTVQSWKAIATRARIIELNPPGWVLWLKDKSVILAQAEDQSIPDESTMIPRDMVDTYIEFVESTISDGEHDDFNYRISGYVGKLMRLGRAWKQVVEQRSRSVEEEF